jgi:hypothetical protein
VASAEKKRPKVSPEPSPITQAYGCSSNAPTSHMVQGQLGSLLARLARGVNTDASRAVLERTRRRSSPSGSGLQGGVVIDPLARQIAQRLKKKLLESSER